MSQPQATSPWRRCWLRVVPIGLPLLLGLSLFSATGRDDSYITNWAAHTLAQFGEIINYNGDRVEQSSSLAHVLILALLEKLTGMSSPSVGLISSIVAGCLSVWLTQCFARRLDPTLSVAAGWLTGSAAGLVYWSFGGLETTLAACTVVVLALAYERALRDDSRLHAAGYTFAASLVYLITRPESICVLPVVLGGLLGLLGLRAWADRGEPDSRARTALRRAAEMALVAALACLVMLAFRQWYFGAWFPQPVIAKARGLSSEVLREGLRYVRWNAWQRIDGAIWILATGTVAASVLRMLWDGKLAPATLMAALFTGAGLGFVASSGGDWMGAGRFLVPTLPMAVVSALAGLRALTPPRWRHVAVGTIVATQLAGIYTMARQDSTGGPFWASAHIVRGLDLADVSWFELMQRVHYRDLVCGERLADITRRIWQRTGRPVNVLSGQMGAVAYRTAMAEFGHVRLIDRVGLVTRDFTNCPVTASLGRWTYGLQLSYDFFFAHRQELQHACGLGDPDIIYDMGTRNSRHAKLIEANGYRIVYEQKGELVNGSRWFPGVAVHSDQFIAVRSDLIDANMQYAAFHFGL